MAGSTPKLPLFSIDVSYWTLIPSYAALSPRPALVIPKASEGIAGGNTSFEDSKFRSHIDGTRSIGAREGAYHFLRPGSNAQIGNQAAFFISLIKREGFTSKNPIVGDLEDIRVTLPQFKQWLDHVERECWRPLIYARATQINEMVNRDYNGRPPEWFLNYWWWIAGYPLPNADRFPHMPAGYLPRGVPYDRLALWQYEEDGVITGSAGNKNDLNQAYQPWADSIGLTEATGVNPMPDNYDYSITPADSVGSKVRSDHYTTAQQITSLSYGKLAYGNVIWTAPADNASPPYKAGDKWLQVLKVDGVTLTPAGWIAEIHNGARYATITALNPVPPDPNPEPPTKTITGATVFFSDGTQEELIPKP